jgi:hypothetical protein
MARVVLYAKSGTLFYVVDAAVGTGCPNVRQDVLLVQFFLRALMVDAGAEKAYQPPGEQPIQIDGACGPRTIAYIKYFQEENSRRNPGVVIHKDCRVDPITSGTHISSITHTAYTIIKLNSTYRSRFKALAANPILDPLFPRDLAKALYML